MTTTNGDELMPRIQPLELSVIQQETRMIKEERKKHKTVISDIWLISTIVSWGVSVLPLIFLYGHAPEAFPSVLVGGCVSWIVLSFLCVADSLSALRRIHSIYKQNDWPRRIRSLRNVETFNKNTRLLNMEFEAAEKGFNSMTPEQIETIHAQYARIRERLIQQTAESEQLHAYYKYLNARQDTTNELALDVLEAGERNADIEIIPLPAPETHEELFEVVLEERR